MPRLLIGGVASRLGLGYETLDDIQQATECVLTAGLCPNPTVRVEVWVEGSDLSIWVGALDEGALAARLRDDAGGFALPRLLRRLVDVALPASREGESGILLVKRLAAT